MDQPQIFRTYRVSSQAYVCPKNCGDTLQDAGHGDWDDTCQNFKKLDSKNSIFRKIFLFQATLNVARRLDVV
jgi:hypothetical protein